MRVVAASNRRLADLVKAGTFRQDLYYRINVVKLILPPLRQRREDIPLLAEHFIASFNRLREKDITGVSPEVLRILMAHDYPGNVRELENIIEHAFVLCRGGMIQPEHLPESLRPADLPRQRRPSRPSETWRPASSMRPCGATAGTALPRPRNWGSTRRPFGERSNSLG